SVYQLSRRAQSTGQRPRAFGADFACWRSSAASARSAAVLAEFGHQFLKLVMQVVGSTGDGLVADKEVRRTVDTQFLCERQISIEFVLDVVARHVGLELVHVETERCCDLKC